VDKFEKNVARDARVIATLEDMGWRVFVAWECELAPGKVQATGGRLASLIRGADKPIWPKLT